MYQQPDVVPPVTCKSRLTSMKQPQWGVNPRQRTTTHSFATSARKVRCLLSTLLSRTPISPNWI